jgi:hypothetical protein
MKIFTVIFCLLVSVSAWCQSSDTTIKVKSVYELLQQIKKQPGTSDPLIMLNDSVYTGNIHLIKDSDIVSIDVLKGDEAKKLFGAKAQNGAFMMKTKRYMETGISDNPGIIALPPKGDDTTHKDTSSGFIIRDAPTNPSSKPLIILDGSIYKRDLKTIDPLSIMNVNVMKTNDAIAKYGKTGNQGAIIITTKKFVIRSYKAKLSSFSKKYQTYLATHHDDDNDFEYVVDGTSFDKLDYDTIIKLYNISAEKIKMVDMVENPQHNGYDGKKEIVNIITKQ